MGGSWTQAMVESIGDGGEDHLMVYEWGEGKSVMWREKTVWIDYFHAYLVKTD
jgi:hypothetical protein